MNAVLLAACGIAVACALPKRSHHAPPQGRWNDAPVASDSTPVVLAQAAASASAGIDCASPPPPLSGPQRASLRVVRHGFASVGHAGGQFQATVRANEAAARSRAEPGALWVEELVRTSDGTRGPILAMHRRVSRSDPGHADWCYVVADHDGTVLRSGALQDCAGCHGAAPADSIFTGP